MKTYKITATKSHFIKEIVAENEVEAYQLAMLDNTNWIQSPEVDNIAILKLQEVSNN